MKDLKLSIDQYSINVASGLIMDTVRNANSGHTGGPLSSLDFTYVLFKEVLKFDPDNPKVFAIIDPEFALLPCNKKVALLS